MPFVTKTFCTDCSEEVKDIHTHDCRESPENIEAANKSEAECNALMDVWDAWEAQWGGLNARAAIDALPTDIAVKGKCILFAVGEEDDYISPECENPTWGEVVLLFNDSMHVTGDEDHCYMEGLLFGDINMPVKLRDRNLPNDVVVLKFISGS